MLLFKELSHLGKFAQLHFVIFLWTKSIKTWILYHQNMKYENAFIKKNKEEQCLCAVCELQVIPSNDQI